MSKTFEAEKIMLTMLDADGNRVEITASPERFEALERKGLLEAKDVIVDGKPMIEVRALPASPIEDVRAELERRNAHRPPGACVVSPSDKAAMDLLEAHGKPA